MGVAIGCAVRLRDGLGRSAAGRNLQESGAERRRVADCVVLSPRATEGIGDFDDADRCAAGDLDLLKLALREERHPFAIRRKERLPGPLRAGHGARLERIRDRASRVANRPSLAARRRPRSGRHCVMAGDDVISAPGRIEIVKRAERFVTAPAGSTNTYAANRQRQHRNRGRP